MTAITYTYEIISVDAEFKCMEVVYKSEKYGLMHVGVRLPIEGESLEDVIAQFAPTAEWEFKDSNFVLPSVGETGSLTYARPEGPSMADQVRFSRNALLSATDWTQVADAPVDQAAWATYRQALRDITSQAGFPHEVVWPVKPV